MAASSVKQEPKSSDFGERLEASDEPITLNEVVASWPQLADAVKTALRR